jgi:hypothetical protein
MIKNLRRIAAGVITMAAMFAVNPVAAHAEQDSTGWWYTYGNSWYTGWKQVDGKWYFFNSNGYMAHDCFIDNYYLNSKGYWDGLSQISPIKFPSNWTKSTNSSGLITYSISNKGAKVFEGTAPTYGLGSQEFCDKFVKGEEEKAGNNSFNISQQSINGKTVDVLDFKYKDGTTNTEISSHQVIFYDNDKAYIVTIEAMNEIPSADMDSFNEMLKTIKF